MNEPFSDIELYDIQKVKIGIAGCGGLGSNTASNLVRLGFKNFKLVDFDKIENSNLNRQFYFFNQVGDLKVKALKDNLIQIEPKLLIETEVKYLDETNICETFKNYDYIVEGFDNVESKIMLIENIAQTKKCICATGLGNYWKVDSISTKKLSPNLTIVGDFISDTNLGIPPLSPGVSIASAKQAAALLEHVIGGHRCLD
jgi:sulfur carrier protein ThiS adenylyltransferase